MKIDFILFVMLFHWAADFLFQSRWMAENKSKSLLALSLHVLVYSLTISTLAVPFVVDIPLNLLYFFLFIFVTHWVTDFITSKITTYFYANKNVYAFFATIGFDQYIHFVCLYLSVEFWVSK